MCLRSCWNNAAGDGADSATSAPLKGMALLRLPVVRFMDFKRAPSALASRGDWLLPSVDTGVTALDMSKETLRRSISFLKPPLDGVITADFAAGDAVAEASCRCVVP